VVADAVVVGAFGEALLVSSALVLLVASASELWVPLASEFWVPSTWVLSVLGLLGRMSLFVLWALPVMDQWLPLELLAPLVLEHWACRCWRSGRCWCWACGFHRGFARRRCWSSG
jgi:hypothetical protein